MTNMRYVLKPYQLILKLCQSIYYHCHVGLKVPLQVHFSHHSWKKQHLLLLLPLVVC